ncbi:MAG: hypothetical protein A3G24_14210 [Betaproteobacteria bacterium RIFCSPLOWO2_12_FULL_62_13]|nr:MAG: hypothetical protein A3G24_14210 [Betaproteobacteria bacterium RIFCSPLOWO2_12_FULL_62_13]
MELRHLRYFLKIAETLSFTRAADGLHISQPTLSHQIKQLEREIGPLLDRSKRMVRLTAQGKVFKTYAERAIKEVETGLIAVAELEGLVHGQLAIGVFRSFSSSPLPQVLVQFSRSYPGVKVFVRQLRLVEIERGLIDGSLDLAITYESPVSEKIVVERISAEPLALIVGKEHPFHGRSRISLNDLDGQPMVLLNPEAPSRQLIDRCLSAHGIVPHIVIEMNSYEAVLATVRCSAFATIYAARNLGNAPDLHAIQLTDPALRRTTAIFWHRDRYRSAAARVVADMVRKAYAGHPRKRSPATPRAQHQSAASASIVSR